MGAKALLRARIGLGNGLFLASMLICRVVARSEQFERAHRHGQCWYKWVFVGFVGLRVNEDGTDPSRSVKIMLSQVGV